MAKKWRYSHKIGGTDDGTDIPPLISTKPVVKLRLRETICNTICPHLSFFTSTSVGGKGRGTCAAHHRGGIGEAPVRRELDGSP